MSSKLTLVCTAMLAVAPIIAMADSDVTAEKAEQNTPSGWTAVQLPSIPTITSTNTYDITSYGATTSSANNTSAIQKALNAVPSTGGMVVIPEGTWLTGPLTIKAKTVLHLKAGATLKMLPYGNGADGTTATPTNCYPGTKNSSGVFAYSQLLVNAKNACDIIVEGEGETSVFEGTGEDWWDKRNILGTRPQFCRFTSGSRFLFRNFKMHNSPGVNLTLGQSGKATNFTVHDVTISNPSSDSKQLAAGEVVSHNTDGIPVWCAYANIYNCNISTGDDNIVVDSNAQYIHAWKINCGYGHGMSFGSYTEKMHDIIYEDITFNKTSSGFRLKTSTGRSGNDQSGTNSNGSVKNIICRNATMVDVAGPIKITSWYDSDPSNPSTCTSSKVTYQTPEFCNILFQNITADVTSDDAGSWKNNSPIYLYGRPEMYIHDITFDNVQIGAMRGMFLAYCKNITFTNCCKITNYSDKSKFIATEYNAFKDNGTTKISADPKQYNGTGTSGIDDIVTNARQISATYNLFGQKVNANAKGIVIVNGKKYLSK